MKNKINPLIAILLTAPFILWAITLILPTFDDWNTLSSPNYDKDFVKFFLPYGSVWRPFDALMGYIVAINYKMFPVLNHICVFVGHLGSTFVIYRLCRKMEFGRLATNIATTFFYLSPCVLGTVLSVDGLNQTYSQLWGLLAVWCYLDIKGRGRYAAWTVCVILAALAKDNGLAWAVVPPLFAFAFGKVDRRTLLRHLCFGMAIAVAYGAIRLSLPKTDIYNPDYHVILLSRKVKEIAMLIGYTWVATDYVSIMHAPSRNIVIAVVTLLLALPFVCVLFFRRPAQLKTRKALLIIACMIITLSPHLLITMSVMNVYAGLGMAAILVAYLIDGLNADRTVRITFGMYLVTALFVDAHHWLMAYRSGVVGDEMAKTAVRLTGRPVDKALCLIIEDDYPRFSSFCVIPSDAFGWGLSVPQQTGYTWPKTINDTTIARSDSAKALPMARQAVAKGGYDCVWIVDHKNINVIKRK